MTAFDDALKVILHHEGGYSNHARDPGGETMLGVTRKVWEEWTGKRGGDMRALTVAKVAPLYRARYWDAVQADTLPPALALTVFDFAINAGPGRAIKLLQGIVNASRDGAMGPATRRATQAFVAAHGLPELVRRYMTARREYYRARPTFETFGKGWLRRCDGIETECLRRCK